MLCASCFTDNELCVGSDCGPGKETVVLICCRHLTSFNCFWMLLVFVELHGFAADLQTSSVLCDWPWPVALPFLSSNAAVEVLTRSEMLQHATAVQLCVFVGHVCIESDMPTYYIYIFIHTCNIYIIIYISRYFKHMSIHIMIHTEFSRLI